MSCTAYSDTPWRQSQDRCHGRDGKSAEWTKYHIDNQSSIRKQNIGMFRQNCSKIRSLAEHFHRSLTTLRGQCSLLSATAGLETKVPWLTQKRPKMRWSRHRGGAAYAKTAENALVKTPGWRGLRKNGRKCVGQDTGVPRLTQKRPKMRWSRHRGDAAYAKTAENACVFLKLFCYPSPSPEGRGLGWG